MQNSKIIQIGLILGCISSSSAFLLQGAFASAETLEETQFHSTEDETPKSIPASSIHSSADSPLNPEITSAINSQLNTQEKSPVNSQTHSATPPPPASTVTPYSEQRPASVYYFCKSLNAYYPGISNCPEAWIEVPLPPPAPLKEKSPAPSPAPSSTSILTPLPETEPEVTERPNVATLEFFGRAVSYSLNYDREFYPHLNLGVGISAWETTQGWWYDYYHSTVTVLPLYANYYFHENHSRGYLSGGLDLIYVSNPGSSNRTFQNSGAALTLGGGYEYRDRKGFLVRLAGYLIIGRSTSLNPSISVGLAF